MSRNVPGVRRWWEYCRRLDDRFLQRDHRAFVEIMCVYYIHTYRYIRTGLIWVFAGVAVANWRSIDNYYSLHGHNYCHIVEVIITHEPSRRAFDYGFRLGVKV